MIRCKAQASLGGERRPGGRGFVLCNEIQISVENRFQLERDLGLRVYNKTSLYGALCRFDSR